MVSCAGLAGMFEEEKETMSDKMKAKQITSRV